MRCLSLKELHTILKLRENSSFHWMERKVFAWKEQNDSYTALDLKLPNTDGVIGGKNTNLKWKGLVMRPFKPIVILIRSLEN